MRKTLVTGICCALAVATALPALALENKVAGFVRIRGLYFNVSPDSKVGTGSPETSNGPGKDHQPAQLVDTRMRAKWTGTVNEYLSFVYFAEIDYEFGDAAGSAAGRGSGGADSADSVNIETKNLNMTVKIPDTPIATTLGIQPFRDNNEGVLIGGADDVAGINFDLKGVANGDIRAAWFKLYEGEASGPTANQYTRESDADFWAVGYQMKPMGPLSLGADFYYIKNQGATLSGAFNLGPADREDDFYISVNGGYKLPMVNLTAWAIYNFGTMKDGRAPAAGSTNRRDINMSGLIAEVRATTSGSNWGAGIRGIYWSSDDDLSDGDFTGFRNPRVNQSAGGITTGLAPWLPWGGSGMQIFITDATLATGAPTHDSYAIVNTGNGYGMAAAILDGSFSPPMVANSYVKGAVGFFSALEDNNIKESTPVKDHDGKYMGTELTARVGMRVAKNLDVSLTGAYAILGNFYNKTVNPSNGIGTGKFAPGNDDPDNPYMFYWAASLDF